MTLASTKTCMSRLNGGRERDACLTGRGEGCGAFARPSYNDMSEHKVTLKWERGGAEFSYQKYPRNHTWSFDGGHTMVATAAPAYLGNPANVDPEEAFVAALSSCHMLTFLAITCKQKFVLDSYEDAAVGHMEKNVDGKMAITRVELRPRSRGAGIEDPVRKSSINAPLRSRELFHCQLGQNPRDSGRSTSLKRTSLKACRP